MSMYNVVRDGMCPTAAPIRSCPLMSEPCMQTQSSGVNLGVHDTGEGGVSSCDMSCFGAISCGRSCWASSRLGRGWENAYVEFRGWPGWARGRGVWFLRWIVGHGKCLGKVVNVCALTQEVVALL
jgi:hypothetical protein